MHDPAVPARCRSADAATGDRIRRVGAGLQITPRIGAGSYGVVWLALNVFGELCAVKVISRSRFSEQRPFEREFEGIQRFERISRSHPSQLAILHAGKNDDAGCFYYVMEPVAQTHLRGK